MPQLIRAIRPMFKTNKWRICRDDIVSILSGPDKGKTGRVLEVFKDQRVPQVIVEGRNMRKKKIRTGAGEDDYFVVTMEAPLHYSQVQVADPDTGKPTRVIFMYTPEGKLVRARKVPNPTVNDIIPTPPEEADPRAGLVGPKDTPAELARRGSYVPAQGFPFRVRNLERIWAGLHPDASPVGSETTEQADAAEDQEDNDERKPGAASTRCLWTGLRAAGSGSSSSSSSSIRGSSAGPAFSVLDGGPRGLCTAAWSGRGDGPDGAGAARIGARRLVASASLKGEADAPSAAYVAEEQQGAEVGVAAVAPPPPPHLRIMSSFALSGLHPGSGGSRLTTVVPEPQRWVPAAVAGLAR